jgi:hypothetical protein
LNGPRSTLGILKTKKLLRRHSVSNWKDVVFAR